MKNIFIFLTIFLFSTNNSSLFSQNVHAGNLDNYRTLEITSSNLKIDSGNVRTTFLSQSGLSIYDLRFQISTSASESVKEILNPNLTRSYTLMIYIRKTSNDGYIYGNFYNYNIPVETLNSNIVIPLSTKLNFVRGLSNLDILQAGYTYEFIFTRAIGEDYFSYTLKL
jgi:hypothetical protein